MQPDFLEAEADETATLQNAFLERNDLIDKKLRKLSETEKEETCGKSMHLGRLKLCIVSYLYTKEIRIVVIHRSSVVKRERLRWDIS